MVKIGTHNSCTGEKGKGFLSWIVTPFARCQNKTIKEQYDSGCRFFDVRVFLDKGKWLVKHGAWTCKKSAEEILGELNELNEMVYVMVTYEGKCERDIQYMDAVIEWMGRYNNIAIVQINIKKPWRTLATHTAMPGYERGFMLFDFSTWHTLLPIPWLWDRIYYKEKEFNEDTYKLVDFL